MNHSIRKTALAAAVALPAALGVQTASAALITDWAYEIDSTFSSFSETGGAAGSEVTGTGTNDELGGNTTLSWGNSLDGSDAQSSLSIDSDVDGGPLLTETDLLPGNTVAGATLTHNNNENTGASSSLTDFMLQTQLFLTATVTDPAGSEGTEQTVGPITFDGSFSETTNSESSCFNDEEPFCDDIFVLTNSGELDALGSGQSFNIDGYTYTVFLDIEDIGLLGEDACGEAGAADDCVGFITQEFAENEFTSTVRIEATEIPAPGVLALLGVGLLGLGFTHRARRS